VPCQNMGYDLRHFEQGSDSRCRLESVTDHERLERRTKKRVESGDYRVCAAHDVAPILEKAFGIKPKDLERDQAFLDMISTHGLAFEPSQGWTGIGKQKKTLHHKSGKSKGKV